MKILGIILLLALVGCVSTPPIIKTVETIVEVPIPVPCVIKGINKPDMPTDRLKKEDELDAKVAAVLAELERRKGYEKELEAATKECQ